MPPIYQCFYIMALYTLVDLIVLVSLPSTTRLGEIQPERALVVHVFKILQVNLGNKRGYICFRGVLYWLCKSFVSN